MNPGVKILMYFLMALFIQTILLILKLTHIISWSWPYVLFPILIFAFVFLFVLIFVACSVIVLNRYYRKENPDMLK